MAARPKSSGKQLRLFEDDFEINRHRYSCYVTTLKLGAADVWRLYRERANCENRIRELKYNYGLDWINQTDFEATEAAFLLLTVACNFLSLCKQVIIGGNVRNRLKTLRYRMPAIPAIMEQSEIK
ncbi:MAG: transposase [Bacteroidales bacterium]|nr:transposase [Bacteroidales bacterium]